MKTKLKPLDQQVMVITGASSGIGLVTAKLAAERGARVLLVARNGTALADAVEEITVKGGDAGYAVADVGNVAAVEAAADMAVARWGRIDTWVNNAGGAIYGKLIDTPLDEHERLFRTNYFGVVHGSLTAVEHLREKGGALVTVGSIASQLPAPILSAYSASKHAAKGFIDALRMELIGDALPISVTLVMPSGIDTPIARHAALHIEGDGLIPPPVYDPTFVAEAILHAAEHVRREITVGGGGRLQVLFGTHLPAVLDLMAGPMSKVMANAKRPGPNRSTLFVPGRGGDERSGVQPGRKFSLYTTATLHRGAVGLVALGIAGAAALIANRRLRAR